MRRVLERTRDPVRRARFERIDAALTARPRPRFDDAEAVARLACNHAVDQAQSKNVQLILHCGCRSVYVRDTFAEALFQLLDNAIDANRPGHPVILDICRSESRTVWQIHDIGSGMTPGALAELALPFYEVSADGSGVGVAVANAIIHEHGGVLRFDSGVGVGTTTTVSLPGT